MKTCYKKINFSSKTLEIIEVANSIIEEYISKGYSLTLRQLYYRFVSKGLLPNTPKNYKRIGSIINDGRISGLLDMDVFEDRTRYLRSRTLWNHPKDLLRVVPGNYKVNPWNQQSQYVEVWVEKDALIGIVSRCSLEKRCAAFSCRGYTSLSALYEASERFKYRNSEYSNDCTILYLGDHDPSGIDIPKDIFKRLTMMNTFLDVKRIALNKHQIDKYNPPPNPAKIKDSRYDSYAREFGTESWELDALSPEDMEALINSEIDKLIDKKLWEYSMEEEEEQKKLLTARLEPVIEEWE